MNDPTETMRRAMTASINGNPRGRPALEGEYGEVWDTAELQRDYDVVGFLAPFVLVRRKLDGKTGTLLFQHAPRLYWGFSEVEPT